MFQFAGFPPPCLCVRHGVAGSSPAGSPHSGTRGSLDICSSPRLFAACRAFRRLLVPRHPPCALPCLTICTMIQCPAPPPSVTVLQVLPDVFVRPLLDTGLPPPHPRASFGPASRRSFFLLDVRWDICPIVRFSFRQYSVFKVQSGGLLAAEGHKWTRTTDLTLIRRAL